LRRNKRVVWEVVVKLAFKLIFGLIYTVVYVVLAVDSTGGGHGTFIFFAPLFTWPLILMALGLTTRVNNSIVRILVPMLLIVSYISIGAMFLDECIHGDGSVQRRWEMSPYFVILILGWYFAGQLIIWSTYILELRRQNRLD